jgi:hypothetical protein
VFDDGDVLVAGVAERGDGTGRELIFQASVEEPDEQDVDLGMDTYCLVTEQQGTAYGCVQKLTIDGDRLRMLLRDDALEDLGLPDIAIEVRLAVDTDAIDQLREKLQQILSYGRESARPSMLRL